MRRQETSYFERKEPVFGHSYDFQEGVGKLRKNSYISIAYFNSTLSTFQMLINPYESICKVVEDELML